MIQIQAFLSFFSNVPGTLDPNCCVCVPQIEPPEIIPFIRPTETSERKAYFDSKTNETASHQRLLWDARGRWHLRSLQPGTKTLPQPILFSFSTMNCISSFASLWLSVSLASLSPAHTNNVAHWKTASGRFAASALASYYFVLRRQWGAHEVNLLGTLFKIQTWLLTLFQTLPLRVILFLHSLRIYQSLWTSLHTSHCTTLFLYISFKLSWGNVRHIG